MLRRSSRREAALKKEIKELRERLARTELELYEARAAVQRSSPLTVDCDRSREQQAFIGPMGHALEPYYSQSRSPQQSLPANSLPSSAALPPGLESHARDAGGQAMANRPQRRLSASEESPVIKRLQDLPSAAWSGEQKQIRWGYNAQTRTFVVDIGIPTLIDSGATNSTAPEELICQLMTIAFQKQRRPGDADSPIRNLRWIRNESIGGIRKDASVRIVAQCELLAEFTLVASESGPCHWIEVLILGAGQSDYPGIILGLPSLDVPPFGLGWRLTEKCHVFDALSVMLPFLGPHEGRKVAGHALLMSDEVVLAPGDFAVLQVHWDVTSIADDPSNQCPDMVVVTSDPAGLFVVGEDSWPWVLCGAGGKIIGFNGGVPQGFANCTRWGYLQTCVRWLA